ncbi:Acetyltransferase (GNAT) family protein [Lentibacillus halodurans]|uniref:Acetyltransferase (GNAT) family protein n=1 Tax=Lentibacillus halodurans TaxID=237679 RepID=A0A1I0XWF4_9BACI|nr:GNAT family N-acetyltransferase [Lentibacillus halodurans]SFB05331.1 Acetyltransferase (GNAT) family protein [Lentibacillus halodurans]
MYTIINGKEIPVKAAANFIAMLNRQKKYHIGFCGTDPEEVMDALNEDITNITAAAEKDRLVGLIGMDAEDDRAEIWGPFVDPGYDSEVAFAIWERILKDIPSTVKHFSLFPNVDNDLVKSFAERLHFKQKADQVILTISKDRWGDLPNADLNELSRAEIAVFKNLHDRVFPGTYYSGQEIIKRISHRQRVFVVHDNGRLAGYAYLEADPNYGEGSIEFIAVDEPFRSRGYGKQLLAAAVKWLFSFKSINDIQLCVSADNQGALGLYQSVGFSAEHEIALFTKKL